MRSPTFPSGTTRRERGVALVIVLAIIVLLAIVVVGLSDGFRMDRAASSASLERYRAASAAEAGVQRVIAQLRKNTSDTKRFWASQPGRLYVGGDPMSSDPNHNALLNVVELSSGAATGLASGALAPAVLNAPLFDESKKNFLISNGRGGTPDPMQLKWIYLRQDGTLDTSESPVLTNTTNPIVSRFAYWVDDEATKLNINTAWKRIQPASANERKGVDRIDLGALTVDAGGTPIAPALVDAIREHVTGTDGRLFNGISDAKQMGGDMPDVVDFNKFELSSFNATPNLTFDGRDRICLTTDPRKVQNPRGVNDPLGPNYIDICRAGLDPEECDPGLRAHLALRQPVDPSVAQVATSANDKVNTMIDVIVSYLKRSDWPVAPGKSFADKYNYNDVQLAQIAAEIIDYVRIKESGRSFIFPQHLSKDATGKYYASNNGAMKSESIVLRGRAPLITELAMTIDPVPVRPEDLGSPTGWPRKKSNPGDPPGDFADLYRCKAYIELYMPNYDSIPAEFAFDFGATGNNAIPDLDDSESFPSGFTQNARFYLRMPLETSAAPVSMNAKPATDGEDTIKYYFRPAGTNSLGLSSRGSNGYIEINGSDIIGAHGSKLLPGERVIIAKEFFRTAPKAGRVRAWLSAQIVVDTPQSPLPGFFAGPPSKCPIFAAGPIADAVLVDLQETPGADYTGIRSLQTDDPRVGGAVADWTFRTNTLGTPNATTVGATPATSGPQQDTDASGQITDFSFQLPAPKGMQENDGYVKSLAELGLIHTGINMAAAGVPWRSLRLQPNRYVSATEAVPDWALLDLFSLPQPPAVGINRLLNPDRKSLGGTVNVNTRIAPDNLTSEKRLAAVKGLFKDTRRDKTTRNNSSQLIEVASSVEDRIVSDASIQGKVYGHQQVFDLPGEILEIKGVADRGESSEETARDMLNQVSTRSNVFSIYSIGQALKQTRNAELVVTGEQRLQTTIERRYESVDNKIIFRTIFSKDLVP